MQQVDINGGPGYSVSEREVLTNYTRLANGVDFIKQKGVGKRELF
jgi:hypothetical protein